MKLLILESFQDGDHPQPGAASGSSHSIITMVVPRVAKQIKELKAILSTLWIFPDVHNGSTPTMVPTKTCISFPPPWSERWRGGPRTNSRGQLQTLGYDPRQAANSQSPKVSPGPWSNGRVEKPLFWLRLVILWLIKNLSTAGSHKKIKVMQHTHK